MTAATAAATLTIVPAGSHIQYIIFEEDDSITILIWSELHSTLGEAHSPW